MTPPDQSARILPSKPSDDPGTRALLFFDPEEHGKPAPAALTELAAQGNRIHMQSRPTHLATISWTAAGYCPNWVVLLRADDTVDIIDLDPSKFQKDSARTAMRLLQVLNIPVLSGGLDLGNPPPVMPFSFDGVFPSDKAFAKIMGDPAFVRWLRSLINAEQ